MPTISAYLNPCIRYGTLQLHLSVPSRDVLSGYLTAVQDVGRFGPRPLPSTTYLHQPDRSVLPEKLAANILTLVSEKASRMKRHLFVLVSISTI